MSLHTKSSSGTKEFAYLSAEESEDQNHTKSKDHDSQDIPNEMLEKLLQAIGRESLRERTPNLQQLEQILKDVISNEPEYSDSAKQGVKKGQTMKTNDEDREDLGMPIVTQLIQRGYLKDSQKWLSSKGFISIGGKILNDILKALKSGEFGLHETPMHGSGSLLIDTTRKYEIGNDIRLLNVPRSLLNTVQRMQKKLIRSKFLWI